MDIWPLITLATRHLICGFSFKCFSASKNRDRISRKVLNWDFRRQKCCNFFAFLVTLFDSKLQVFKNSPKLTIFNQLLFTKNVNVECDFFCYFQTPCLFLILQGVKNQLIFWGQLANAVDADKIFKKLCLLDRLDNAWQTSKFCLF